MRILICDDQPIIRNGLSMILTIQPDMVVVGQACDGIEAIEQVERLNPDMVLMDLKMPRMNGVEAIRQLRARHPHIRILVLTTYDDDSWLFDALHAGAAGYILKDTPPDDLLKAIRGTPEGKTYLDPSVAGKVIEQLSEPQRRRDNNLINRLSERECEILRLLARGMATSAIGSALQLSDGTVRNYISVILTKLEVEDRTQAVVFALQYGLVC